MDSYKSDIVTINHPIELVYSKLSTPSSFKNIANIDAELAEVQAQMAKYLEELGL